MKKKTILKALAALTLGSVSALGLALAGCGDDDGHTHSYSKDWANDVTGHWHEANCGDLKEGDKEFKSGFAGHNYGEDDKEQYCLVCEYPNPDYVAPVEETKEGIFKQDGTLLFELEASTPTDTAKKQYGSEEVALEPGDVFIVKIDGVALTHKAGELELWLTEDSHGVTLNQADGTFTVNAQAGDEGARGFKVYAKYYENGTPCWSIYVDDGLDDKAELVENGAYLVGTGWTNNNWNVAPVNYIDPDKGLTVTLGADSMFKIAKCVDGKTNWAYNDKALYKVKDDAEGYLNFVNIGPDGNGAVLAAGEYTITVEEGEAGAVTFVFTPAADLKPAELPDKYVKDGKYLVGTGFAGNDLWAVNENYYIDPTDGLTVTFTKNAKVQVVNCNDAKTGGADWIYKTPSYFTVKDAGANSAYITFSGGEGTVLAAGEYTVTVTGTAEAPVFHFEPAAGVEPVELVERAVHYYIKGTAVDAGWGAPQTAKYELKETEAGVYTLTIDLAAGEFMFYSMNVNVDDPTDVMGGDKYIQSGQVVEGNEYVTVGATAGANITAKAAGTYTFTYTAATDKLDIAFTPSSVAPVETVLHYYIKGSAVPTVGWGAPANEDYELKAKAGEDGIYEMEIDLNAGAFMFYTKKANAETGAVIGDGDVYIQTGKVDEDSKSLITSEGNGDITIAQAGSYKFTYNSETEKLTIVLVTPAAPVETVLHYYIKGGAVPTVGWGAPATEDYELKAKAGEDGVYEMEIELDAGAFMFYTKSVNAETGAVIGDGDVYIKNDKVDADSQSLITSTGGGDIELAEAGKYKFTYNTNGETPSLKIEKVTEETTLESNEG